MVEKSNKNVFLIQKDASINEEFEISEFEYRDLTVGSNALKTLQHYDYISDNNKAEITENAYFIWEVTNLEEHTCNYCSFAMAFSNSTATVHATVPKCVFIG